jgi:hypothetical protein
MITTVAMRAGGNAVVTIMGIWSLGMAQRIRKAAIALVLHDPGEFPVTTAERSS